MHDKTCQNELNLAIRIILRYDHILKSTTVARDSSRAFASVFLFAA